MRHSATVCILVSSCVSSVPCMSPWPEIHFRRVRRAGLTDAGFCNDEFLFFWYCCLLSIFLAASLLSRHLLSFLFRSFCGPLGTKTRGREKKRKPGRKSPKACDCLIPNRMHPDLHAASSLCEKLAPVKLKCLNFECSSSETCFVFIVFFFCYFFFRCSSSVLKMSASAHHTCVSPWRSTSSNLKYTSVLQVQDKLVKASLQRDQNVFVLGNLVCSLLV